MKTENNEFLKILTKYQGILHKVSLIYFRNKSDREDILQEIIYQLWKSFPNLKNKDSIGSWIYSVSINTSLSRIKKKSLVEYRDTVPEISDGLSDLNKAVKDDISEHLLNAIHNLDDINKSVILLYLEEKSYDEIAAILGVSKSNVGVRINRAKKILKENLKYLNYGK